MGIFSKLFPSREARLAEQVIANVRRKRQPISDLAKAITTAAMSCGNTVKPNVHFESEDKKAEQWVYVCFEFIYFFIHMTDRIAFLKLGAERRARLMKELDPLIVDPAIEAFFPHWPDDLKSGLRSEFRQKLNNAQRGYSACKGLISEDNPVTGNSLFSTLARNIAELCGHSPTDLAAHIVPFGAAIDAWKHLSLEKHIEAVGKVL